MLVTNLCAGEYKLNNSPSVRLSNGNLIIPQHYLQFKHDFHSVESIIADCEYDDNYIVFVSNIDNTPHITIGIIGHDNYRPKMPKKIVYGRNWRVEKNMPTSEVIQTTFLAIQKAKEHENRELFRIVRKGKNTTPFNNHQDIPFLSTMSNSLLNKTKQSLTKSTITNCLKYITYGSATFSLSSLMCINSTQHVVTLGIKISGNSQVPELQQLKHITIIVEEDSVNIFLHTLLDYLLKRGNQHVENNFKFKGFKRFCRSNDVTMIADLAIQTRSLHKHNKHTDFRAHWENEKYQVDSTRVPKLNGSKLKHEILKIISKHPELTGFKP